MPTSSWFFKVRENQGKEMLVTAMFQQSQSPEEDQLLLADKIEIELTHIRRRANISN
ncbi:MAG: hypothetical protein K0R24_1993 [Gammaproteobacteria bacterium]|jgi:hypothetical protein|nr:hypothetical protein [Gammaproteobacteria bacterium]